MGARAVVSCTLPGCLQMVVGPLVEQSDVGAAASEIGAESTAVAPPAAPISKTMVNLPWFRCE